MYYKLEGKNPVLASMMEASPQIGTLVAYNDVDGHRISTLFLGIDHQFGDGPPLLFETMWTPPDGEAELRRYSTWDEAEKGHNECLDHINGKITKPLTLNKVSFGSIARPL